jgi:hypothetical protein
MRTWPTPSRKRPSPSSSGTKVGHLVENGNGLRLGSWKLILGGKGKPSQLFDLAGDVGETTNVAGKHPDTVAEMGSLLRKIRDAGRSRE